MHHVLLLKVTSVGSIYKFVTVSRKKLNFVRLYYSSYILPSIHKCYPSTVMCRSFYMLRFRPVSVRSLLSNLVHRKFLLEYHVDTILRLDTRSTYKYYIHDLELNSFEILASKQLDYKCMPLHSAIGLSHKDKTCLLKIWSTTATMNVVITICKVVVYIQLWWCTG